MLQANTIFVLNPDYHFKSDKDRIVMYSGKKVSKLSSEDWVSFLHPLQAQILNSFSHILPFYKQCELLANKFNITKEQVGEMVKQYVKNSTPIFTTSGTTEIYFPRNVLLPLEEVEHFEESTDNIVEIAEDDINIEQDRMHVAPQSILLMLTNKCVTNCKYCYADKKQKYIPLKTSEILHLIDEAKRLRMSYIDVIGGEVFCRKDWDVIIKKMVDCNLMPNFISTKVPISERSVEKLHKTGYNNVVQISLDSMDDYILHEQIGSSDGYISKMKQTIRFLGKFGFKVQIDTILTRLNANKESLEKLCNYISTISNLVYWEIRVPEVSIYTPHTFKEIKASREQLEMITTYIRKELMNRVSFQVILSDDSLHSYLNKGKNTDKYFHGGECSMLRQMAFILPDGKVSACEQLYWHPHFIIGDLRHQTIEEIWNSPKAWELFHLKKSLFSKDSACSECKIFDFCNNEHHRRCFVKVIKAYGKENWDYPDPRCQYAPKVTSDLEY